MRKCDPTNPAYLDAMNREWLNVIHTRNPDKDPESIAVWARWPGNRAAPSSHDFIAGFCAGTVYAEGVLNKETRTCSPASSASPAAASSSPSPSPSSSPSPGTCTPVSPSSSGSSGDSSVPTSTTPSSTAAKSVQQRVADAVEGRTRRADPPNQLADARSAAANLAHALYRSGNMPQDIISDTFITLIADHLLRYKGNR